MSRVRVLVANRPRLMQDLVLAICDHPDVEIVGKVEDGESLEECIGRGRPDFLILALDESATGRALCDFLLREYPQMKILALSPDGNTSVFYWASFATHARHVECSEAGILNILRGTAAAERVC